jgi:hypothetical protein
MKKIIGVSALGLGIVISTPLLAHGPGGNMQHPMQHSGMMPMAMMHSKANLEQHLSQLKKSLQLTKAQQPAWNRFAQAVKTMAVRGPMGHNHGDQVTSGDMASHFARMEQRMAQMKTVFEARKVLVETLSEDQKKAMENVMSRHLGHHG